MHHGSDSARGTESRPRVEVIFDSRGGHFWDDEHAFWGL